jgi:hypothetical protein
MNFSDETVKFLCEALEKEPLFHMSLGSKELFHSNFLAWFANRFPEQAAAVFRPWTVPIVAAQAGRSKREAVHLDLILHLPNLAPIAVENKVFSVPSEEQLDHLAEGPLAKLEAKGTSYTRILLSLMSPGWSVYKNWRLLSYRELGEALRLQVASIRAADTFAGDLVEHYIVLISKLVELVDLLGTPRSDEPLLLNSRVETYLRRARVSAGVQKARASCMARELRKAIAEMGWFDIQVKYGFTKGSSLLQGFCHQEVGASNWVGDALGWQLQGAQFRLAVITGVLRGQEHRQEREAYVADRYSGWFDFAPLVAIAGTTGMIRASEMRGSRWIFQGYKPDFVYRYRIAAELTPTQIIELGLLYLGRAREILNTSGRTTTPFVIEKRSGASEA